MLAPGKGEPCSRFDICPVNAVIVAISRPALPSARVSRMAAASKGRGMAMYGRTTRRMALAALVVMVAGSAALGAGHSASAKDNAKYIGDYGNKAAFKATCEGGGGTFIEDDGYGNTECHYPDGTWIECDANGNDCWYTPPSIPAPPSGIQRPPTGGTIISAPIVDGTTQHGDSGEAASAGDQDSIKVKSRSDRKSKKRGHHGKRRKH
jgi:hypothetical protein